MSTALAVYHGRFGRATLYNLNRCMAVHAHREGHLTFFVHGAPSKITIKDRLFHLDQAEGVAINPWEPHDFQPGDLTDGTLVLVLYIKPIWFLEVARSAQSALRFGRNAIELTSQIQRSIRLVTSLLLDGEQSGLFEGYLYELTQQCFDQSWQWMPEGAFQVQRYPTCTDFRVRRSMRLLSERLGAALELDEVARQSGLSRPHFYKLFRKQTGLTPNLYVNTLRMERAIDSLTVSEKTVTDIGFDLGFSSQASFTRFFTANVGIAPSDYRRAAHLALC